MSIRETIEALRAECTSVDSPYQGGGRTHVVLGMERVLDALVPEIALLEAERDACMARLVELRHEHVREVADMWKRVRSLEEERDATRRNK